MKKSIKIIFIIFVFSFCVVLLDTLQAKVFNKAPFFKIRRVDNDGIISYVDESIFVKSYQYVNGNKDVVFRWEKYEPYQEIKSQEGPNENESEKKLLELPHRLDIDLEKDIERKTEIWNMKGLYFDENIINDSLDKYENKYGKVIEAIKKKYSNFNPKNWNISVNMYSDDGYGTMQFHYIINDKILSNKSISFTIEDNVITFVYFTNMEKVVDEDKLLDSISYFEEYYEQSKKVMQENEEFESEEVMYHYYYNIDKLLYIYQLYFYEFVDGEKILNNYYVSEYIVENAKLSEI